VWALEAYGAAYTLQELLTVKSDDVPDARGFTNPSSRATTRSKPARGIVQLLIKEMQSLGLDVKVGARRPSRLSRRRPLSNFHRNPA